MQFLELGLREGGYVRWHADEELGAACYLVEVRRRAFVGKEGWITRVISLFLPYSKPSSPAASTPVGPGRGSAFCVSIFVDNQRS